MRPCIVDRTITITYITDGIVLTVLYNIYIYTMQCSCVYNIYIYTRCSSAAVCNMYYDIIRNEGIICMILFPNYDVAMVPFLEVLHNVVCIDP